MSKQFFGLDRLHQYRTPRIHLDEGIQGMLEMWWSGHGVKGEKPVITGITVHYEVEPKRRRIGRGRKI